MQLNVTVPSTEIGTERTALCGVTGTIKNATEV
jgi:hypothetical protein